MSTRVATRLGLLAGSREGDVSVFRGIPFAKAPVGVGRFAAPQAPAPGSGTRDATRFGSSALQADHAGSPMNQLIRFAQEPADEDCLFLNVWTPAADAGRRPVLVFIHGGAFVFGSGSQAMYDGRHLAARGGAVVVTINYRLGAFGWLHTASGEEDKLGATGNQGLLDQVAALRWVRDEIDAFGGDPGNVTVFGESAGAISISALLAAKASAGLFHKAILQSGSANLTHPATRALETARRILADVGLDVPRADGLRGLSPLELQAAQDRATPRSGGVFYGPVVDGHVLERDPFEAIAAGSAVDVPVLVGTNLDEWRFFMGLDPRTADLDEAGLAKVVEVLITPEMRGGEAAEAALRVIATVREARSTRGESTTPADLWFAIGSDYVFRQPAMRLAELQSRHAPAFAYLFEWPSPVQGGIIGAGHLVEVPFVFGTHRHPTIADFAGVGDDADRLSRRMQDAWMAFARSGSPNHDDLPEWHSYDPKRRATLRFGATCQLEDAPREPERTIWDALR